MKKDDFNAYEPSLKETLAIEMMDQNWELTTIIQDLECTEKLIEQFKTYYQKVSPNTMSLLENVYGISENFLESLRYVFSKKRKLLEEEDQKGGGCTVRLRVGKGFVEALIDGKAMGLPEKEATNMLEENFKASFRFPLTSPTSYDLLEDLITELKNIRGVVLKTDMR